jgi:geranylgeranyl pyrophosphate synthase
MMTTSDEGSPHCIVPLTKRQPSSPETDCKAAAFQRVADIESLTAEQRLSIIKIMSTAVGFNGMVGGQALDLAAEQQAISVEDLRAVHYLKTGALIRAAAESGAVCGKATLAERQALVRFAEAIGLAFQVTDDVLDVTGDSAQLGKTAGKDERAEKINVCQHLGVKRSAARSRTPVNRGNRCPQCLW